MTLSDGVTDSDIRKVRRLMCNNWREIVISILDEDPREGAHYKQRYKAIEVQYKVDGESRRSVISRQADGK